MRSVFAVMLLCSTLVVACASEAPTSPDGASFDAAFSRNAPTNSVSGGGKVVYDPDLTGADYAETYGISARTRPDGSVEGMIEGHWPAPYDVDFHGAVDCMRVQGSSAWLGFAITRTNHAGFPVGSKWIVKVADNGTGPNTDAISYFYRVSATTCQTVPITPLMFAWTNGNITIR